MIGQICGALRPAFFRVFLLAALILSAASRSWAVSFDIAPSHVELEAREAKIYGGRFKLCELPAGGSLAYAVVSPGIGDNGTARKMNLVLVDRSGEAPKILQRIKLGDGAAPELERKTTAAGDVVMLRVLRGDAAEAHFFDVIEAQKLRESFRANASTPSRAKLDIKAQLRAGAQVDINARRPAHTETLDMIEAMHALIEDEIFQENGRPVPTLVNLQCRRHGWEGEGFTVSDDLSIFVGLTLETPTALPVANCRVIFTKQDARWQPTSMTCEPFMAYQ